MVRVASYIPHLGAALGAGLMLASSLAFNAGARLGPSDVHSETLDFAPSPALEARPLPETPGLAAAALEAGSADPAPGAVIEAPAERRPRLAVIVDDVGPDLAVAEALLALDAPVTLSILPYAPAAPVLAQRAADAGLEVFLHLPMEPVGLEDPGPGALTKRLSAPAMARRVQAALARVPGAVGFNNHMGSRLTADPAAMESLFASMDEESELIFLDSLTHPNSVAADAARSAGFRALRRDVFLDHDPSPDAIEARLTEVLALAGEQGTAIAIAHPRPETLAVLRTLAARAEAAGVELVAVSALAETAAPGAD